MILRYMRRHARSLLLAVLLALVAGLYVYLYQHGLTGRHVIRALYGFLGRAGAWGPVIVLLVFALQTVVPIPNVLLAALTGSFYGPWLGSCIVFVGWLVSASVSFAAGRYFGKPALEAHSSSAWVKEYRELVEKRGFETVMFMRVVQFPADIVGLLCGVTRLSYREYIMATALGVLPGAITFTVLGRSWTQPVAWLVFGVLFLGSVALAFAIKRTRWFR